MLLLNLSELKYTIFKTYVHNMKLCVSYGAFYSYKDVSTGFSTQKYIWS